MAEEKTLFQKIIDEELPATFHYKDDKCVVISDKYPDAPLHLLIIPRKPIPSIHHIEDEDLPLIAHMIKVAKEMASKNGCEGYKLLFNVGKKGGQVIFHLHLHLLGWN